MGEAEESIAAAGEVGEFLDESAAGFFGEGDDGGERGEGVSQGGGKRQRESGLGVGVGAGEVIGDEEDDA